MPLARLPRMQGRSFVFGHWSWPYEPHIAANDVPELGELVEAMSSQPTPDARGVHFRAACLQLTDGVFDRQPFDHVVAALLGALVHGTELEHAEHLTVLAHAALKKEDRAAIFELDRDRDREEQRAQQHKECGGSQDVDRALDAVLPDAWRHAAGVEHSDAA